MKVLVFVNSLVMVGLLGSDDWRKQEYMKFTLHYSKVDENEKSAYARLIESGIESVELFFDRPFQKQVDAFIHPNRESLDSQWQKDWGVPDFKSECWMVASGVATRLDVLSPTRWGLEACEHVYADSEKTARLFTHELVHVYHGQQNASPDFSDAQGIDWFVEGLATYASGQCDKERLEQVIELVATGKAPGSLDMFWTGKYKYGLAGSAVMFIDKQYGRKKLSSLLPFNRTQELLASLKISEEEFVRQWTSFVAAQ